MGIDNLWRTGDLHLEGVTGRLPEACNGRRPGALVNRHIVAGALLAGAVLMSVAPAQAEAPVEPHAIGNSEISSGSAALNRFFCGTIWRPICV
ncbi:hypothetical protein IU486_17050 [Streptomyces gardneri]|nr:hypothetical protein [Streptomyces gardneri]